MPTRASGPDHSAGEGVAGEVTPPQDVTSPETLALAVGFPDAGRQQWRDLVAAVLEKSRGADGAALPDPVEDALRQPLGGGVDVAALYVAEDAGDLARIVGVPGLAPFVRGRRPGYAERTGWDVRARHAHPDAGLTRAAISTDLENGVTSLWLVVGDGMIPAEAVSDVLADVLLDVAPVVLQAGSATPQVADALFSVAATQGVEATALAGNVGADPYGDAVRTGSDPDLSAAVELSRRCRDEFPTMRSIMVDGTVFHDAGGGVVEELGCSLAAGVGYLRVMTDEGLDVDAAFDQLDFRYSASADQFLTIAGMRAARRLWNRVGDVSGASPGVRGQRQHAVTSSVMMTRRDPWVNMLRTTMACATAAMGGADAITVLPFTWALGRPDAFARRIARNTQLVLMEESGLARVTDPAGGSWAVERLTEDLARRAWDIFQSLEAKGGMADALASGFVQDQIAEAAETRARQVATGGLELTGSSAFPMLGDDGVKTEPWPSVILPAGLEGCSVRPLRVQRLAEPFEALRDAADAFARTNGRPPRVFLASLGTLAAHAARSTWMQNFLAAGGVVAEMGEGYVDATQAARAFSASGLAVACICGSDRDTADHGENAAAALRKAGAKLVLLAGRPGEDEARLRAAGVDDFIHAGCDMVAVLRKLHAALGVASGA